ncbi:type I secretion system permease/ATPase [Candidatus Tisiphia endosymbiont of Oplodontha viridula]|uniref:type I secretion system permease/ATPase n=1 Tax=Candidatus Tisiphia endosymbiont of Oplodontha viridula TaxID=3077925 RepID=UPI0035C901F3
MNNQEMTKGTYGIAAIVRAAQHFQIVVTEESLAHKLGVDCRQLTALEVCKAARLVGLRAKWYQKVNINIASLPLPLLVCYDEQWSIIEQVEADGYWLRYDLASHQLYQESLPQSSSNTCNIEIILLAENEVKVTDTKFSMYWFLPSVLKHIDQLRDVLLLSLMLQLISLVSPMLFQNVIDQVLVSRGISSLHILAIAMLLLAIAEPLYSHLRSKIFTNLSSKVNTELSARLYRHLLTLPLNYFCQRQTGQIVARIREMEQIRQFLTGSALMLVLDIIFILMFIAVMFNYSSTLTWLVLGSLTLYAIFWFIVGPILRYRVTKEYDASSLATAYLTETITGVEVLKTTATEPNFLKRWQQILASQLRATFSAKKVAITASQGINLVQKLTSALLLWIGVKIVLVGKLTVGELVAFNMLAGHVTQPILRLAQVWQDFQHTIIALRRIGDILDTESEAGNKGIASVPKLNGKIEFQYVRFRYQVDTPEVLKNLSFTVQAGEFIGITGPSGSGKSTLTRLLQRLYIPQHGRILVDGMDIAIADPTALRCNMSIVLQDNMLFAGTLYDNIKLCYPETSEDKVIQAAKLAGADSFIKSLPQGYQTIIGEKGSGLSGGQRQRIALARALLVDPRILILDEATSALDYESEAAIMANLDSICYNRTVISVAHRLNTIRYADRILVLDQGIIVECGTHSELLANQGMYFRLWTRQTCSTYPPIMDC